MDKLSELVPGSHNPK